MTKLGSLFLEPSVQGDMFILQIQMFTSVKLHLLCFVGILTTSLSLVQSMIFEDSSCAKTYLYEMHFKKPQICIYIVIVHLYILIIWPWNICRFSLFYYFSPSTILLNAIPFYLDVAFDYLLCFFICSAAIFGKTDWNTVGQIGAGEWESSHWNPDHIQAPHQCSK